MRSSHHRNHHARRLLCLTALACFVAGGAAYACTRKAAVPQLPELPAESLAQPAEYGVQQSTLTAAQAQAILDDPRMILVSRTHPITEDYPVETKECGSATAINKTLQTEAADAFLSMQAAAAKDGVDVRMQSGYRSVSYQKKLYDNKTQYYRDKGLSEAAAREKAAVIVNPPGCSEHNCGLAADLNSPEHTTLDTGFADTAAFRWLCENAKRDRHHLRAVALALCRPGKRRPAQPERPVSGGRHRRFAAHCRRGDRDRLKSDENCRKTLWGALQFTCCYGKISTVCPCARYRPGL